MTVPTPGQPRRHPQTVGGAVFLGVVAMAAAGVGIIVAGPWRGGVAWLGASLLVGSAARAVLSEHAAGMLRVRRRWPDVLMMAAGGVALLALAVLVPDQRV